MNFILGLRHLKIIPANKVVKEFPVQKAICKRDVVSDKKGKLHEHRCGVCYCSYECDGDDDCSKVKLGLCSNCHKKMKREFDAK